MLRLVLVYMKTKPTKMCTFILQNGIDFVTMFKTRTEENVFTENQNINRNNHATKFFQHECVLRQFTFKRIRFMAIMKYNNK
jgi:hypothetical protein